MWWKNLNTGEQEEERQRSGPPEFEVSVTYQIWKKFMKPHYRKSPQLKDQMSPESSRKLMEHIRKIMDNVIPTDSSDPSIDDCDFVVRKQQVRVDGPCICGSDRIFRECCGREIVANLKR